jgi:hypothetical protein
VYADTLLVLLLFLSASLTCLAEQPVEKQKERATVAAHCAIAVFRGGEQIATAGTELLTGLESVDVNLPKISDYQKVTIQGFAKGRLATAEYSITRDKMHDRIILSYSRRGTAKLVVPELAFDDWIVDVSKLEIE